MHHPSKLPKVGTTIFTVMSALAQQHGAINLSQGFPNFESDPKLIDLVSQAMQQGYNQYAPMAGNLELRLAIAHKYQLLYNSNYNPEQEITVTAGATQAIFTIISAFVRPKEEVIIFTPAYDCYQPAVELNGGITIEIPLHAPDYRIDWNLVSEKISNQTKLIIINTPHNPSGTILTEADMLQLEQLTNNTNILVLSDEVYEHIIFDGANHESICKFSNLKARSFITASFGKTFHNTGWKIGYCCAPKDLMTEFRKVHQFNVFSVHHPAQKGLADYMQDADTYLKLGEFFQHKRDLFLSLIAGTKFTYKPAQGSYFQVLNYTAISDEADVDFAKQLTVDYKLAAIPLSVFYSNQQDDHVLRFCFAKTDDTIKKAADILRKISEEKYH